MRWLIMGLLVLVVAGSAIARDMKFTIYDDGRSCPADCDAHFVMNAENKGTGQAFRSGSWRRRPEKCVSGKDCTICFEESGLNR
jgi:hypothetical protein